MSQIPPKDEKDGFEAVCMRRAVALAKMGGGLVSPNPQVGAVIARDGKVLAEGFHARCGGLHAERAAIEDARTRGADVRGAAMFVTLEPCCHTGRQPPCTEAIIEAGISQVYAGSSDPNPLVSGKGIAELRAAGIRVTENFLKDECDALNPIFFHYIRTRTPYIILKYAMSANGVYAAQKISGEESQAAVHRTRARVSAVAAGISTVIADDPMLNCRPELFGEPDAEIRQPVRIVLDPRLELPPESRLARTAAQAPVWDFCLLSDKEIGNSPVARTLESLGVRVLPAKNDGSGRIDLAALARFLGAEQVDSVLLESGGILAESALKAGIVQKIHVYLASNWIFAGGSRIRLGKEDTFLEFDAADFAEESCSRG